MPTNLADRAIRTDEGPSELLATYYRLAEKTSAGIPELA